MLLLSSGSAGWSKKTLLLEKNNLVTREEHLCSRVQPLQTAALISVDWGDMRGPAVSGVQDQGLETSPCLWGSWNTML